MLAQLAQKNFTGKDLCNVVASTTGPQCGPCVQSPKERTQPGIEAMISTRTNQLCYSAVEATNELFHTVIAYSTWSSVINYVGQEQKKKKKGKSILMSIWKCPQHGNSSIYILLNQLEDVLCQVFRVFREFITCTFELHEKKAHMHIYVSMFLQYICIKRGDDAIT